MGVLKVKNASGVWEDALQVPTWGNRDVAYKDSQYVAGADGVEIDPTDGNLVLVARDSPLRRPQATNRTKLVNLRIGNGSLPALIPRYGAPILISPTGWAFGAWTPQHGTTTVSIHGVAGSLTGVGTVTAASPSDATAYTRGRKVEYLVTTPATNAIASLRHGTQGIVYRLSGYFGWIVQMKFGMATGCSNASHRGFIGLSTQSSAPTDADPSSQANLIGLSWDSADTTLSFLSIGTGLKQKFNLGSSFPKPTVDRTDVWDLIMFEEWSQNDPNLSSINWMATNLSNGAIASGTTHPSAPASLLYPRCYVSVGGVSSVVGLGFFELNLWSQAL